jgi:aspartokinase
MLSVVKIGGSALRDDVSFQAAARFLALRSADRDERLGVFVSAQHGATDALLPEALAIASDPDHDALDLLWSTGELRSVALPALHLQRLGVRARALNVQQTGRFFFFFSIQPRSKHGVRDQDHPRRTAVGA